MSKVKEPAKPYTGPVFEEGTPVIIKRPSMWWTCSGLVEKVNATTGEHIVRVDSRAGAKYPHTFPVPASGNLLDVFV